MQNNDTEGMSVEQFRYQTLLQQLVEQTAVLTEKIVALQTENQVLRQRLQMNNNNAKEASQPEA